MSDRIVKEAGFVDGFLKQVVDKVGLSSVRERPFEMIFGIFGTAIIWKFSKLLGAVAFFAESMGYGPGLLGKAIDKGLKKGDSVDLSDGSLKSASKFAIADMLGTSEASEKTSSMESILEEIYVVKKSITVNDFISAAYVSRNFPITKTARTGRAGMFRRFLSSVFGGRKLGLANILYGILKLFATGLIGLGIAGGVKGVVKDLKGDTDKPDTPVSPADRTPAGAQFYKMEGGDVADTLVKFLNTIKFDKGNFESVFQQKYNRPIRVSPQMGAVLVKVRMMNGGVSLNVINRWDAFFAPKLKNLANMFMPGFVYERDTQKGPSKELSKLLKGV